MSRTQTFQPCVHNLHWGQQKSMNKVRLSLPFPIITIHSLTTYQNKHKNRLFSISPSVFVVHPFPSIFLRIVYRHDPDQAHRGMLRPAIAVEGQGRIKYFRKKKKKILNTKIIHVGRQECHCYLQTASLLAEACPYNTSFFFAKKKSSTQ